MMVEKILDALKSGVKGLASFCGFGWKHDGKPAAEQKETYTD